MTQTLYKVRVYTKGPGDDPVEQYLTGTGRTTSTSAAKACTFESRDWAEKVAQAWCAGFRGLGYNIDPVEGGK